MIDDESCPGIYIVIRSPLISVSRGSQLLVTLITIKLIGQSAAHSAGPVLVIYYHQAIYCDLIYGHKSWPISEILLP